LDQNTKWQEVGEKLLKDGYRNSTKQQHSADDIKEYDTHMVGNT